MRPGVAAAALVLPVLLWPAPTAAADPQPQAPTPAILIQVRTPERTDLVTFAAVLEGRLLTRLQGNPGFRLAKPGEEAGYGLLLEILDLQSIVQPQYHRSYDADSDPSRLQYRESLALEMDVDLTLTRSGKEEPIYEDSLTFAASRMIEDTLQAERLRDMVLDDLMERVAEKIPRILKRRLKG